MRAISALSLEAGTSTFGWRAWIALRTRVSMSAMGSLVIFLLLHLIHQAARSRAALPTRLDHAGNLAVQGELAETEAANTEFAQERARPSAAPAAVAVPALELGGLGPAGLLQFQVFCNL